MKDKLYVQSVRAKEAEERAHARRIANMIDLDDHSFAYREDEDEPT